MATNIDINAAVVYNSKRPYTREQWHAIVDFLSEEYSCIGLVERKIEAYQQRHYLRVDGKLGPETERHMVNRGLALPLPAPPYYDAARAIEWACSEIEVWQALKEGKQRATLVSTYWGSDAQRRNWCGAFVASALEVGGLKVPPDTRRGAKRLTMWVAEHGRWIIKPGEDIVNMHPEQLQPGDVLCWNRGALAALRNREISWHGHVAILRAVMPNDALDIFEGNSRDPKTGKHGQLVRRILGPGEWPQRSKDGLRGLYGVARP